MSIESPATAVYARALLEAAGADAPTVADEIDALATLSVESPRAWDALIAPELSSTARKAALWKLYADASPITRNFLAVLVDRGRIEELPAITERFRALVKEQQKQLDVHVTTAIELAPELRSRLEDRLTQSTGKQVQLHTSVDPEIIGGLVIAHGDTLIDTSLRGRLDALRLALKRSHLSNPPATD